VRAGAELRAAAAALPVASDDLAAQLTDSETRVLGYLPTNLSAPEIARELSVTVTTVRTHLRHLFAKLGAYRLRL
jgi:LuxR family maltose regulon positive regulatory protein